MTRHRWYAGGIATILSAALVFTGMTPALAEDATPTMAPTPTATSEATPAATPTATPTPTPATKATEEALVPGNADETEIQPLALIAEDCTSNCAELTLRVVVSGGSATAADWSLLAVRDNNAGDEYAFTSGQKRDVPRNSTYALSATPAGGVTDGYETAFSCTTSNNNIDTTGLPNPSVEFPQSDNRSATCTFTQTKAEPGVITVQKGGFRTGDQAVAGLGGATFEIYSGGTNSAPDTAPANLVGSCETAPATGRCSVDVPSGQRYWIVEKTAPTGWAPISELSAGDPASNIAYSFRTAEIGSGSNTTYPQVGTGDGAKTSSGYWADIFDNPEALQACGIRVGLLIDLSNSISSDELLELKTAANGFVDALEGTPSTLALWTFATSAPALGADNGALGLTSVATGAGATTVRNKIDGLTRPGGENGGTNWDQGLWQVAEDAANQVDVLLMLTDGTPTFYGPSADGPGDYSRFREVESAVFSSNAVKDLGTRVIPVGIGVDAVANIQAISGPTADSDYFLVDNYEALALFLENLAKGQCESTINVTKLTIPVGGDTSDAVATPGWAFDAESANTVTPGSGVTNDSGAISFKVDALAAGQSAEVTITEEDRTGYSLVQQNGKNAVCENDRGNAVSVTNDGAFGFKADATGGQIVTCTVYNQAPNPQVKLQVVKKWVINGENYDNDDSSRPFGSATLKLDGSNAVFGNQYTYNTGDTVAITETVTGLPAFCTNVATGTGPHTMTVDPNPNVVTITNTVTCTTQLQLSKKVLGDASPSSWTLTGTGPESALSGPTGSAPTSLTDVTPGARYVLAENGGSPLYTQEVVDGANPVDGSTGSWHCYILNEDGTRGSEGAGGLNGWVEVQLGQHVDCEAINETATLVLRKHVVNDNGGDLSANAWQLTADPGDTVTGLTPTTVDGNENMVPANTIAVRPNHDYTISESTSEGYEQVKLQQLIGGVWTDVDGWTVSVPERSTVNYRIVNDDIAPTLTLVKRVDNKNGLGTQLATDWTLTAAENGETAVIDATGTTSDGGVTATTATVAVEAGVAYELSEAGPDGYDASEWVCDGGTFADGAATLGLGEDAVCTITNTAKEATGYHEKEVVSTTQAADGTWTVVYDVTVYNTSEASTLIYDLDDTLRFGSGIVVTSASWVGPAGGGAVDFESEWETSLAANASLPQNDEGNAQAVYTVTATATIAEFPAGNDSWQSCSDPVGDTDGGFLNEASLTIGDSENDEYACSEPSFPTIVKTGQQSVQDGTTGEWTVSWEILVANPGEVPVEASVTDVLPEAPDDWTLTGGEWTVLNGADTPAVNLSLAPSASPQLIWESTDGDSLIPAGETYTFVVSGKLTASAQATSIGSCDPQTGTGGLINTVTVSSGEATASDTGCVETETVPATASKSVHSTEQLADGTWSITYLVTVENETDLVATYDLADAPLLDGTLIVPGAARWATSDNAGVPTSAWTSFDAASGTDLATDKVLVAGGVDYYVVELNAEVTEAAWEDGAITMCAAEGSLEEGGFLNSVTLTSNGESDTADACSTPALPTVEKTGVSAMQNPENPDAWIVTYEVTVTPSGYDTFYTLNDEPGFANGLSLGTGTAQRAGDDTVYPITAGASFPPEPVALGAAAEHKWTVTWNATVTADVPASDRVCNSDIGAGKGLYNHVDLLVGDSVVDESDACIPVTERVYPSIDKTVTSSQQDAETGKWTITYSVVATLPADGELNPEGLSARYGLSDELMFGGDISVDSATWRFEDGDENPFAADGTAVLAVAKTIPAGATHTYTVTVVADVAAEAIEAGTTVCYPDSSDPAGGFLNTATLSTIGQTTMVDACAEPVFPEIYKIGSTSTQNENGSWNISYDVTVSYPQTDADPLPSPVGFTLTDEPVLPAGVTLADGASWTATATDGGPLDNATWNGEGTWTLVEAGELIVDGDQFPSYTYEVSAVVDVVTSDEQVLEACGDVYEHGIVIWNDATVTSGAYKDTDDGCTVVHVDDVGIVKTSELPEGETSVAPGDVFDYVLTVTNYGTRTAYGLQVTDDDLNDRLEIVGLDVEGAGWSPSPGYEGNVVDLTLDALGVGESATITLTVEFLPYEVASPLPYVIHGEATPTVPTPLESLDNTACVQLTGQVEDEQFNGPDNNESNNCDDENIPTRDVVASVYTSCLNDAALLGWTVSKSELLVSEPIDFVWMPTNGDVTPETSPSQVAMTQPGGTATWSDEIPWPGAEFNPAGISIDYPGWRAIERSDLAGDGQYYLPGTTTIMTPEEQAQNVFNGLILDPSELDFAWRGLTTGTFSVNPEVTFTTEYPTATPECAVARHTEVEVDKTASVDKSEPGESFTYDIAVANVSTDSAAEGVVVTDSIPADLKITDVSWPGEDDDTTFPYWETCEVSGADSAGYGGSLECVLTGPLQPLGSDNGGPTTAPTITLTALVNASSTASVITNVAVVDYYTFGDPEDSGRDSDDAIVLLSALPVTGGGPLAAIVMLGLLAVFGGGVTVLVIRRRRNAKLLL
ncbi:VWA domain-containing protein [Microbacterium sp. R86528]|uniref:VWA domain-containing protein n=1 Tax=Microbacterium sp. R86528 TaxID=3093864 RepID=UPI0037C6436C